MTRCALIHNIQYFPGLAAGWLMQGSKVSCPRKQQQQKAPTGHRTWNLVITRQMPSGQSATASRFQAFHSHYSDFLNVGSNLRM